jgi:hypothetical protein
MNTWSKCENDEQLFVNFADDQDKSANYLYGLSYNERVKLFEYYLN